MSHPKLFQQAEPNHGAMVTIATFQAQDKESVLAPQATLEEEIHNVIAPGQESNVFLNELDGIWFGGVDKNKNGINFSDLKNKKKDDVKYSALIYRRIIHQWRLI
jgi:hypothetical protein